MSPSTFVRIPLVAAMFLAVPAYATDLYKWVDERGVTNYSNEPPANAKAARKLSTVEDRVSVYTPDKTLLQAVEATRQRMIDDARTGRYERQLEAERLARLRSAPAEPALPAGYDPCLDAANVDLCNNRLYAGVPYGVTAGVVPFNRRHRIVPQARITPGTTAGDVVGMNGFIPGNSAFAPGTVSPVVPFSGTTREGRGGGRRR